MNHAHATPEELAKVIEASFANSVYPGDDCLVPNTGGEHLECEEIAMAFRGRRWSELPLDMLLSHSDSLCFLMPEAYVYYLPAYLIATVLHYEEVDTISSSVVFSLIPPERRSLFVNPMILSGSSSNPVIIGRYWRIMELFTAPQRQAICCFLEFMKRNHKNDVLDGEYEEALNAFASEEKEERSAMLQRDSLAGGR